MDISANQPIMIVEDSPEDYEATIRAFRRSGLANKIIHCNSGDDALDYLWQRGPYADKGQAPPPGIILLDLNMPGTDGRDVLREVKTAPLLKKIPVIVLTTSCDAKDIDRCYAEGANSYICKPVEIAGFFEAIQRLRDYWFEIVVLPKG